MSSATVNPTNWSSGSGNSMPILPRNAWTVSGESGVPSIRIAPSDAGSIPAMADQGGFPRAVASGQADPLPLADGEGHAVNHPFLRAGSAAGDARAFNRRGVPVPVPVFIREIYHVASHSKAANSRKRPMRDNVRIRYREARPTNTPVTMPAAEEPASNSKCGLCRARWPPPSIAPGCAPRPPQR